ncbi:hypothetical protein TNCV_2759541 [Trichonephila clavipes]|nr:hypothetical protein TNCV_2759541 [Trichonephila clavipes]
MRAIAYYAHPNIRDHWALRYMSRCPDQVVSLNNWWRFIETCTSPSPLRQKVEELEEGWVEFYANFMQPRTENFITQLVGHNHVNAVPPASTVMRGARTGESEREKKIVRAPHAYLYVPGMQSLIMKKCCYDADLWVMGLPSPRGPQPLLFYTRTIQ